MLRSLLQAGIAAEAATVVETTLGPYPARVIVRGDVIVSATAGPFVGVDAVLRLSLSPRQVQRQPVPTSLTPLLSSPDVVGAVDVVLAAVDAQRAALDKDAAQIGGWSRVLTLRFSALARIVDGLPDDVQRVARLADGSRDIATVVAEADLAPAVTLRVLGKLIATGIFDDVVDDRDGGERVDRSWQRPSSAPTPAAPSWPIDDSVEWSTPGTKMPAPTVLSSPQTLSTEAALSAETSSPIVDVRPPVQVNDARALPAPVAHPRDAQAWLGDDEAFFRAGEGAAARSLSTTTMVVLVVVGVVLGGLLAAWCG